MHRVAGLLSARRNLRAGRHSDVKRAPNDRHKDCSIIAFWRSIARSVMGITHPGEQNRTRAMRRIRLPASFATRSAAPAPVRCGRRILASAPWWRASKRKRNWRRGQSPANHSPSRNSLLSRENTGNFRDSGCCWLQCGALTARVYCAFCLNSLRDRTEKTFSGTGK